MAETLLQQAIASVVKIQDFKAESLARTTELGSAFSFSEVVPHSQKIIGLYKQIPTNQLDAFPENHLNAIKAQADSDLQKFEAILSFDPNVGNPQAIRTQCIQAVISGYQQSFDRLFPYISYLSSKESDFVSMRKEASAVIKDAERMADEIRHGLDKDKKEADAILGHIRNTAAEQGVSQQASYFKQEADYHAGEAKTWRKRTQIISWFIGVLVIISLFIDKIPFIKPADKFEMAQLITGKILVFGVVSFMLILSSKNFLSHKHNEIVNRHRQNALLTFNALVSAAENEGAKDTVLSHAASCIFSPQETGYTKTGGTPSTSNKTIVELLPNAISTLTGHGS